jgi:hypothetical protein
MKRIDDVWWRDATGYYKQVSKGVFEGPFDTMSNNVVDSGEVELVPAPQEVKVDIKFDDAD